MDGVAGLALGLPVSLLLGGAGLLLLCRPRQAWAASIKARRWLMVRLVGSDRAQRPPSGAYVTGPRDTGPPTWEDRYEYWLSDEFWQAKSSWLLRAACLILGLVCLASAAAGLAAIAS